MDSRLRGNDTREWLLADSDANEDYSREIKQVLIFLFSLTSFQRIYFYHPSL
jgi:hypothetical protein